MIKKTEVWSVPDFMSNKAPTYIEGVISRRTKITLVKLVACGLAVSFTIPHADVLAVSRDAIATTVPLGEIHAPVSAAFDRKIWPLLLDIGKPLAKTMMAMGIYKCIRNDVDRGWKMVWRSGVGLGGLFLVDGAIHIISGVGQDLSQS